jgi:hypothetical protein
VTAIDRQVGATLIGLAVAVSAAVVSLFVVEPAVGGASKGTASTGTTDVPVTVSDSEPFTIRFDLAAPLLPGAAASPLDLEITNPNGRAIQVTSLTVSATGPSAGCPATNFAVLQFQGDYSRLVVPGGAVRRLSALDPAGTPPSVRLRDLPSRNQDGCRRTPVTLSYSGTAQGR